MTFGSVEKLLSIEEADDLIQMSFTGATQPIQKAIIAECNNQWMQYGQRMMKERERMVE